MINHGTAYVLRTCNADMTSLNGFRWPESGYVEAPDWVENEKCGGGLHGFLWGAGDGGLASWHKNAKWLVVKVDHWIDLGDQVKFKGGEVVYAGEQATATSMIYDLGSQVPIVGLVKHSDKPLNIIAGDKSTLTGGDGSTLTGGWGGILKGGHGSTLTAGYSSTLMAGHDSILTGGDRSTLMAGDDSTLKAGHDSTLKGGDRSTLIWEIWDGSSGRYRLHVFYTGEGGCETYTSYRLVDGKLVEVV